MIKRKWEKCGNVLISKIPHVPTKLAPKLEFYEKDSCIYTDFGNRPENEIIAYTEEVYPGIAVDFRADGTPCGIDVFAIVKKEKIEELM
jgi:hypothetical protein